MSGSSALLPVHLPMSQGHKGYMHITLHVGRGPRATHATPCSLDQSTQQVDLASESRFKSKAASLKKPSWD